MKSKSPRLYPAIGAATLALSLLLSTGAALAGNYREADVQAEIKRLADQDDGTRKSAAFHLSEMGAAAKSAVPALTEIVQSDVSMSARGEASHALGNIGPAAEDAVPAIIGFLQNLDGGYERTYAASALGDIHCKPEQAVPALMNALKNDKEPVVRQLAARALGGFGAQAGEAIPLLADSIKNGDKDLREAAAYGLQSIPATSKDLSTLTSLLSDEIDSARIAAAKSIGGMGSEAVAAVPDLVKLLTDSSADVKCAAANALGMIGPEAKNAIPALKTACKDSSVAMEATQAIKQIKSNH